MEVYKKINNNVALARDAKGRELVVFGKGIGFASMPYELTNLSCIQRTFYDVNEKYFALLRDVPEAVFLVADDIADTAREELDCTLNANLTYALADHLNFAIQRSREGLNVQVPLAYDIQHLYPQEYAIAKQGLHALCRSLALHAQALGQVGDGATRLLEHIGHAAGDIGGAGILADLLALGTEVVENLLAALDGNGGGAEAHVDGTVNKLIEFHNHGWLQS